MMSRLMSVVILLRGENNCSMAAGPAETRASELGRELLHLGGGEDGPVLADVHGPDIAAAALAEPALHAVLERGEDGVVGEAQLLQHRQRELDHHGRAADDGHGVVRLGAVFSTTGVT